MPASFQAGGAAKDRSPDPCGESRVRQATQPAQRGPRGRNEGGPAAPAGNLSARAPGGGGRGNSPASPASTPAQPREAGRPAPPLTEVHRAGAQGGGGGTFPGSPPPGAGGAGARVWGRSGALQASAPRPRAPTLAAAGGETEAPRADGRGGASPARGGAGGRAGGGAAWRARGCGRGTGVGGRRAPRARRRPGRAARCRVGARRGGGRGPTPRSRPCPPRGRCEDRAGPSRRFRREQRRAGAGCGGSGGSGRGGGLFVCQHLPGRVGAGPPPPYARGALSGAGRRAGAGVARFVGGSTVGWGAGQRGGFVRRWSWRGQPERPGQGSRGRRPGRREAVNICWSLPVC